MSKKFKHLNLSPHWQQYFSKYPQGYTIIENLIDWVSQVDSMVDSYNELTDHVDNFKDAVNNTTDGFRDELDIFLGQFDDNLTQTVVATLSDWQDSGFLNIVINEALDTKYHEMDDRLTAQLAQTESVVNVYVSPENFNSLDECIEYARENKKIIKADYIKLEKPTNFRGVGLEISELEINGYSIELGDYNVAIHDIPEGFSAHRPTQKIETIYGRTGWGSEVFIRGASYQTIEIGHYSGNVQIRVDEKPETNFVAYNEFHFRNVRGVELRSDSEAGGSVTGGVNGWINENTFYLMNTRIFKIGSEGGYTHNLNRIYGGGFEANGLIEILSGRSNYFYDIRGEQNLKIRFGKSAIANKIELAHVYYLAELKDDSNSKDNVVVNADERNMRIKHQHSISTNFEIGGNESGFNMTVISPFKNIRHDDVSKSFIQIPRTSGSGHNILYVSPYISQPQNVRVLVESHLKTGDLGIGFKMYDKDYMDITQEFIDENFAPYMMMSNDAHISNTTNEGRYESVSNYLQLRGNITTSENVFGVKNDILSLTSSGFWGGVT